VIDPSILWVLLDYNFYSQQKEGACESSSLPEPCLIRIQQRNQFSRIFAAGMLAPFLLTSFGRMS
jgi:hypothetical protein